MSSSQRPRRPSVSIYDYPEHLNPFNDDTHNQSQVHHEGKSSKESKHKFWTFGRSRKKRSNSFSIKSTWWVIWNKYLCACISLRDRIRVNICEDHARSSNVTWIKVGESSKILVAGLLNLNLHSRGFRLSIALLLGECSKDIYRLWCIKIPTHARPVIAQKFCP